MVKCKPSWTYSYAVCLARSCQNCAGLPVTLIGGDIRSFAIFALKPVDLKNEPILIILSPYPNLRNNSGILFLALVFYRSRRNCNPLSCFPDQFPKSIIPSTHISPEICNFYFNKPSEPLCLFLYSF